MQLTTAQEWRTSRESKNGKEATLIPPQVTPTETVPVEPDREVTDGPAPTFNDTLAVVRQHFGDTSSLVDCAEACIAAMCGLLLAKADCCVALVLEGPASSGKTTALNFFMGPALRDAKLVVVSDSFTPAAFISHAANRKEETLRKNDLLPRIQHKGLIVPDLAPTLSDRPEELAKNLGKLIRVLDGQGYESDSGTHGHRGYVGDYRFTLLAATTPLSSTAWGVLGKAGNRLVLMETGSEKVTTDDLVASMLAEVTFSERVEECASAVSRFYRRLYADIGGYASVEWDHTNGDTGLVRVIARVAEWVCKCRGHITMESDGYSEELSLPHIEAPHRLVSTLYNLAKGRAIACGRRELTREDVQLAVRIGLDSMPLDRRRVVRALLRAEDGVLTSAEVEEALGRSRPTANKATAVLKALGAVDRRQEGRGYVIALRDSEKWLLDDANRWALARLPA